MQMPCPLIRELKSHRFAEPSAVDGGSFQGRHCGQEGMGMADHQASWIVSMEVIQICLGLGFGSKWGEKKQIMLSQPGAFLSSVGRNFQLCSGSTAQPG